MKRSTAVVLVISGAILGGCSRREEEQKQPAPGAAKSSQVVTNDTYVPGRGYYHSPFYAWYPYPYNFFSPGLGYYRGGGYHPQPDLTVPRPTYPGRVMNNPRPNIVRTEPQKTSGSHSYSRGGFTRSRSSGSWSSGS